MIFNLIFHKEISSLILGQLISLNKSLQSILHTGAKSLAPWKEILWNFLLLEEIQETINYNSPSDKNGNLEFILSFKKKTAYIWLSSSFILSLQETNPKETSSNFSWKINIPGYSPS